MGHWLDNDRQTEHGAVHKAEEGASRPTKMEDKTLIGRLAESTAGLASLIKRFAVAARALPRVAVLPCKVCDVHCVCGAPWRAEVVKRRRTNKIWVRLDFIYFEAVKITKKKKKRRQAAKQK